MSSLRPGGVVFDPVTASQQLGDLTTGKVLKLFVKKSLYFVCVFHQDERLTIIVSVHTPVITQVNKSPSCLVIILTQFPRSQHPRSAILVFVELGDWRQSSILSR